MTTLHVPPTFQGSASDEDGEPWLGYIRVSTWREEKISPELQRSAIEAWAARTGRRIVDWITDLDATGRNFKRKIMRGIERVEGAEAVGIAVWKYSRFGRNDVGIAINLARLERAGGQLGSATEDIDARTAVGKFNRAILFDLAVFESDRAGEQWKDAHRWRREHGLPATGGRRLGYIWHPRRIPDPARPGEWIIQQERYEIDPDAEPHISTLYDRKTAGDGYGTLAEWLTTLGYRTSNGRPWRADSLRRYMDAGFAGGLLRVHHPECHCDYTANGGRCTRWVHIDGAHDPIITPEQWERYQAHRERAKRTAPRARNPLYPLTGLVRCGLCRGDASATSARRRGRQILGYAYYCGNRSHAGRSICEQGVWVQRAVVESEVRDWIAREVAAGVDTAPPIPVPRSPVLDERARAAAERDRLQAEADRLAAALTNLRVHRAANPGEYGPGEYEAARDHIRQQQQSNQAALERVVSIATAPARADYAPVLLGLLDAWQHLEPREANELLRQVARRVVCTRQGRGSARTLVEVHPIWEPDPWDTPALS